jgi:pantoate--beta-alanine ligase
VIGAVPLVVRSREELRTALGGAPRPVGLVPTMGALHEGHASLIRRARAESATVVVSIFVNPTQFETPSDLAAYPRSLDRDVELCAAEAVDIVFAPMVDDVYPPGAGTSVHPGPIAEGLEGTARPGHFVGVATVVAILFGLVGPERAYFGEKDGQQLRVVGRMALDLGMSTAVVGCATVRERDGLAMSSRNARLTIEGRAAAPVLRSALLAARAQWLTGERDGTALRDAVHAVLAAEPRARVDYVSVADAGDLREIEGRAPGAVLCSLAAWFGDVRLIDNETLADG